MRLKTSRLFEIASVLVALDHVVRIIISANHRIMERLKNLVSPIVFGSAYHKRPDSSESLISRVGFLSRLFDSPYRGEPNGSGSLIRSVAS
jgi:hypothetical protein